MILDKNQHISIEAPMVMALHKIKDNVTMQCFLENQDIEHQVSQTTEPKKTVFGKTYIMIGQCFVGNQWQS